MSGEEAWGAVGILIHQKCLVGLPSGICSGYLNPSFLQYHVNYNCSSYKDVLQTLWEHFEERPHMDVTVRCPHTFGHTVYVCCIEICYGHSFEFVFVYKRIKFPFCLSSSRLYCRYYLSTCEWGVSRMGNQSTARIISRDVITMRPRCSNAGVDDLKTRLEFPSL